MKALAQLCPARAAASLTPGWAGTMNTPTRLSSPIPHCPGMAWAWPALETYKSAGVVVPDSFGVAKGLQQRIGLQDDVFDVLGMRGTVKSEGMGWAQ